jgi:hypothetical protein
MCGSGSFYHKAKIVRKTLLSTVLCSVADLDPESGAFLTPGSGIRNEQPGSYFLERKNHFFGLKYLNSLQIRGPGCKKVGYGINIPDLQHWFCDFFITLSLKNDVNVPSRSNKQKN